MAVKPGKFRREPEEQRKMDLIRATLSLISEQGIHGATVRAIADRANVTQGLIRHYFQTKEDLIGAAYEHHMKSMTEQTASAVDAAGTTAKSRLCDFVVASLKPPVVDAGSVTVWASFLNKVREDERMRNMHEQTYYDFRDRLERLIGDALSEEGASGDTARLRYLAIACNAVIDGLWLEGGALPSAFAPDELPTIGLRSVAAITGIELSQEKGRE